MSVAGFPGGHLVHRKLGLPENRYDCVAAAARERRPAGQLEGE